MSSKVLVTGAQGFVGRHLVAALLAADPAVQVVGLGRSPRRSAFTHAISANGERIEAPLTPELMRAEQDPRYAYVQTNICDREDLRRLVRTHEPCIVYHLASGLRDDEPRHLFRTNVEGTIALLEAVHDASRLPCTIVAGSTGSAYGIPRALPIAEDASCEPRDFYAVSKLAAEHAGRILARERDLQIVWARIFNIVGPGQDERHAAGRFASQIAAMARGNTSTAVLAAGDLSTTRDFVDVRDVANALIALARGGTPGSVYNVASGEETKISRIVEILAEEAGLPHLRVERRYVRESDIPRVVADVSRLQALGFNAAFALRRSLRDVLAYYAQNVPAASAIKSQR